MKKLINKVFVGFILSFLLFKICTQPSKERYDPDYCARIQTKQCVINGRDYPTCEYLARLSCKENKIKGE